MLPVKVEEKNLPYIAAPLIQAVCCCVLEAASVIALTFKPFATKTALDLARDVLLPTAKYQTPVRELC